MSEFWLFVQQTVNGLVLGSAYSLVAVGYTLVFGVLRILNMAHGEILMAGGFFGLLFATSMSLGLVPTLIVAALGAGLLGVLMERLAIRPLSKANHLAPLITTIGVSTLLQSLATRIFGPYRVPFPPVVDISVVNLGPLFLTSINIMVFVVVIVLVIALKLLLERTDLGRAIRAKAENPEVASFLGVNVDFINWFTVGLASALAGVAGVLLGLTFGVLSPHMGIPYGLKGLVTLIVGGMGSIQGAMVAGLLLGVTESLTVGYILSAYRDAVAFSVLIAVLLLRPSGLFGSKVQVENRV